MSVPTVSFVYDRYHKASSGRKASVEIRISYNGKQKYISTGIRLYPKEWKKDTVVNTPDAQQLNQQLDKILIDVRQILIDMSNEDNINIYSVPERLEKKQNGQLSMFQFFRQRIDIRKYNKSSNTQYKYERFFRFFKKYGKVKSFGDITEASILAYDQYLKGKGLKEGSRWHNYHKYLNALVNDSVEEGYVKKNPYKALGIGKGDNSNGISRRLSLEEFRKIQKVKLPTECLEKVRDVFVFQTYTCLSYCDLADFNPEAIIEVKGMKVYIGSRDKTDKGFTIPLLPVPVKILKKYNNKLPVISNVNYNQYLKLVAQAAGIEKPVSTHWARHTGATILLNAGVPMQIVSKICGHSSTKITEQVYAKLLDETVVEAIKKLQNKK